MQYLYVVFRRSGAYTFKIASDKPLTLLTQMKNILLDMGYTNTSLSVKEIEQGEYRVWEVSCKSDDMYFVITERFGVIK